MTRKSSLNHNNVHISGSLIREVEKKEGKMLLEIASPTQINAIVEAKKWYKFKSEYPNIQTISVSGILNKKILDGTVVYIVNVVNDNSIGCFHNIFDNDFDFKTNFFGTVILKKKFQFETESNMYLKRMVFETTGSGLPTTFEAVALRSFASYFDEIEEESKLILKAVYVSKNDGYDPYWKITNKPILI